MDSLNIDFRKEQRLFGIEGKVLRKGLVCPLCGYDGRFHFIGSERGKELGCYSEVKHIFVCPVCDERILKENYE